MSHESPRPGDDHSDSAYEFIKFLSDPNRSKRMVEGAYEPDGERERALLVVHTALQGVTVDCETCEGVCEHQVITIRDAFMRRAHALTTTLSEGLRIYQDCRTYGIDEPAAIIERIYDVWSELSVLFDYVEPQNHLPDADESDADAVDAVEGDDAADG